MVSLLEDTGKKERSGEKMRVRRYRGEKYLIIFLKKKKKKPRMKKKWIKGKNA